MQITPEVLEDEFSLTTAATRLDFLSRRDNGQTTLNTVQELNDDDWSTFRIPDTSLDVQESLELLALGEVVARKAHDSRLVGIRAALRGGAGWPEVAAALDVTPGEAWDVFQDAIAQQSAAGQLDDDAAAAARHLAGDRPTA